MSHKCFVLLLFLSTLACLPLPVHAGGVVDVCDEAHLRAAMAGGGMVTFACSGTITLSAEIKITADTTIDGSGQAVTISGNHAVRVFQVSRGARLSLNRLAVANGRASLGGGIHNDGGILILNNSNLSGNRADCYMYCSGGAIYSSGGTVAVSSSTFVDNSSFVGAGINTWDTLIVDDSTFANNRASYGGGGIASGGTSIVRASTFSGNHSLYSGGAIYSQGSALIVGNSTFSDNSANNVGGAIAIRGSTVTLINSTLSGNAAQEGGSVYGWSASTITLTNTIIASSPQGVGCSGKITDGGGNLSYPDTTCPGINADPILGPLQDNGGSTYTMALGRGSAALDAANDVACAVPPVSNLDQRGVARPQGLHCDIGAVEQETYLKLWLPLLLAQGG